MSTHSLQLRIILTLALAGCAPPLFAANNDPVVLVHGFLGFGPEQFVRTKFKYWGGYDDLATHMRVGGKHTVLVASVGSISSNWDRAAELYAQIKGGCVDYGRARGTGKARSGAAVVPVKCWTPDAKNNPNQYPVALFPAWDAKHPIHLLGHSQGGQTIRALIQLLEHGAPDGNAGGGDLYLGGKIGWVKSATTISAPHNGTSLHDATGEFGPTVESLSQGIATLAGAAPYAALGSRHPIGTPNARAWDQEIFDSVQHEMAPDGARIFNAWARTSQHVYYFSVANVATEAGSICCNDTDRATAFWQSAQFQYPRRDMAALTRPYAGEWIMPLRQRRGLGSYTQSAPGRVQVDSRWFPNDGVVNTVSMRSPEGDQVRDFDGVPMRGAWNFLGTYRGFDHFDMVGWPSSAERMYPLYDRITGILFSL